MDIQTQISMKKKEYDNDPTFEKLEELRDIWVTAQNANEVSEGFKNLLTQLYPDNAHYIFELLQNAQDANKDNDNPSTVSFILSENKLEFEHDGEKLFDLKDVESITGLGISTKKDDKTNVGKFGVGFKSVFAITNTPEIISGEYHFKIEKLFIPKLIKDLTNNPSVKSRFIFPFNNPKKNPQVAVEEIRKELIELGSETLLFLNNIKKIEYLLPDGKTLGYMEQMEEEDGIDIIKVDIPNEEEKIYYWLRYRDKIIIVDENGKDVVCPIAIAFKLEENEQKDTKSKWKIIPPVNNQGIDKGEVCIFFPATKEISNLYFHIHAPFASTVARDSIRDCEENNKLRDSVAELIAKALIDIKKRELLSIDFLGILPNADDNLSPFYEPIRKKIVSTFKENPLVPTKNGNFASAIELFRCPPSKQGGLRISEVIDDDDLSFLIGREPPLWVKNAKNQRDDKFLASLEIKKWGPNELEEIFNSQTYEEHNKIETWINNKSDEWLMKLYALLYNEEIKVDTTLKIIRLTTNHYVSASEVVYFLPKDEDDIPSNLNFVKRDVYEIGDAEKRKKDAYNFLEKIGVKLYTENEKTMLHLKDLAHKYSIPNSNVSETQHLEDIEQFIQYEESKEILKRKYFVLNINGEYCTADTVCSSEIGELIECTCLESKYKKYTINSIYDKLKEQTRKKFYTLLEVLGAMNRLTVVEDEKKDICYKNKIDYLIIGIENILPLINESQYKFRFSLFIWNAICECDFNGREIYTRVLPNDGRYKYYEYNGSSTIVKVLSSNPWLPDKDGNLYNPKDISIDMLPSEFEHNYNQKSHLLNALKFGEHIRQKREEEKQKLQKIEEAAATLGLSLEQVNIINKAKETGIDIENILNAQIIKFNSDNETDDSFNPQKTREQDKFPIGRIKNLFSLQEKINIETSNAKPISYKEKLLRIRISRERNIERNNIGEYYGRFCQLCGERKTYWDVAQIFKIEKREIGYKKEIWYMNLSLCPMCARKYRKLRKSHELMSSFRKNIIDTNIIDASPEKEIEIELGKERVRFRHDHLAEIQEILKIEAKNNPLNSS